MWPQATDVSGNDYAQPPISLFLRRRRTRAVERRLPAAAAFAVRLEISNFLRLYSGVVGFDSGRGDRNCTRSRRAHASFRACVCVCVLVVTRFVYGSNRTARETDDRRLPRVTSSRLTRTTPQSVVYVYLTAVFIMQLTYGAVKEKSCVHA